MIASLALRCNLTQIWSQVEDVRFWLPQYPFHIGSKYFVEKYGLVPCDSRDRDEGVVKLKGVTAAQFRVFLKFLLPV
jgi:hypothetical protein